MLKNVNMLAAAAEAPEAKSAMENLKSDGIYAVIGVLIVFAVLALLFIVLKIVSSIVSGAVSKDKKLEASPAPAKAPTQSAPAPVAAPAPVVYTNDAEIVAAISAAISLLLESEGKDPRGFRVVSFRRSSSKK